MCNTAVEERQFIRNCLQAGQTPEQVIAAVNSTFGWLKPEFATQYDSLAHKTHQPSKRPVPTRSESVPLKSLSQQSGEVKLATTADRMEILTHFQCPCGQCGVDELKDCSCDHPHGAKEVKAFVDGKIAEGKYTVAQLIEQVERLYGARKF